MQSLLASWQILSKPSSFVPGETFSSSKVSGRREAGSDASEPLRIVGGCLNFSSPSPVPAKMSDMEDDFMCDDEEATTW